MKKFVVAVALFVCVLCFVACGQKTDKNSGTDVNQPTLTLEERKDIFASYFNNSDLWSANEVRANLNITDPLAVLTLDEALAVFWQANDLNPKDYLQKTDENGHVYYQHKVENNEIRVFVNLLYDEDIGAEDSVEYGFYVIQSNGQNYFINVNGDITPKD